MSHKRLVVFLLFVPLVAFLHGGCKSGTTSADQKVSAQQAKAQAVESEKQSLEAKLQAEKLRATRLEGQIASQAGLAAPRGKDSLRSLQLDLMVAMSFRARLDALVAARDFKTALSTARRLQDLMQFIKAELPAVRVRICLERARLSLTQINRQAAIRAVIQAQNITLDEYDATPYLLPPESSQLDAARKALIDGDVDAATQSITAVMKAATDTPEEVLANQALGSVAQVINALNREAVISAQAELSQLAETLGSLNDRVRGIGLRREATKPAATPEPEQETTPAPTTPEEGSPEGAGGAEEQPRASAPSI